MSDTNIPILFFIHLSAEKEVPDQLTALSDHFQKALAQQHCELVFQNVTSAETFEDLFNEPSWQKRPLILYFSGKQKYWPTIYTALSHWIPKQRGLELLFLNGLASEPEARHLSALGVRGIIRTSSFIHPDCGHQLAERFFISLAKGAYVIKAWNEAIANIKIRITPEDTAKLYREETIAEARYPWDDIFVKRGARSVLNWNLPDAVQDPTAGLPEAQFGEFPDVPFRELKPYEREHAPVFAGRAKYIRALYNHLTNPEGPPVISLYGQSGVGKSSLLAAGLQPYIERDFRIRTIQLQAEISLPLQLQALLEKEAGASDLPLDQLWKKADEKDDKPMIILLDQAEEIFTNSRALQQGEAAQWGDCLQSLLGDQRKHTAGKILLSYRQSFHPEMEQLLGDRKLASAKVYLARFTEEEIRKIVKGLGSTPELQEAYQFEVEDTLPENMARFLLEDPDSAISPVLQLLLSALWKKARQQRGKATRFNNHLFNQLRKEGNYLEDFFHQQLNELEKFHSGFVDCGLTTDLMSFMVSNKNTSITRSEEEILARYPQHREAALRGLLEDMVTLNLLSVRGKGYTLGHDLLAPLALLHYQTSLKPGQRAERLLKQKATYFEEEDTNTLPSFSEAKLIEEGKMGMAKLSEVPEDMVWWKPEWFFKQEEEDSSKAWRVLGMIFAGIVVLVFLAGMLLLGQLLTNYPEPGNFSILAWVGIILLTIGITIILIRTKTWSIVKDIGISLIVAGACIAGAVLALFPNFALLFTPNLLTFLILVLLFSFPFVTAYYLLRNRENVQKYFQRNAVISKIKEAPLTYGYFMLFRTILSGKFWKMIVRAIFSFTAIYIYTIISFLVMAGFSLFKIF